MLGSIISPSHARLPQDGISILQDNSVTSYNVRNPRGERAGHVVRILAVVLHFNVFCGNLAIKRNAIAP